MTGVRSFQHVFFLPRSVDLLGHSEVLSGCWYGLHLSHLFFQDLRVCNYIKSGPAVSCTDVPPVFVWRSKRAALDVGGGAGIIVPLWNEGEADDDQRGETIFDDALRDADAIKSVGCWISDNR